MALLEVRCFSEVLGMGVSFHVLLPEKTNRQIGMNGGTARDRYPTLYLLHGLSDDHSTWLRRTSIERYAAARNLAVVMPAVARSYYQDMASGPRFWTFLSLELPALCQRWFPLSPDRDQTFAAGLSMGGYGALRLALAQPERFAAAASLSGALDLGQRLRDAGRPGSRISLAEWKGVFGENLERVPPEADLYALAEKVGRGGGPKPALFLACGTEDELINDSRDFRARLSSIDYPCEYEESPGAHEWGYWDAQIQRVLAWLPL
ncbi:MAG: alpha/beta hydrolase family protein [Chthoniobacteraceae bacterium]